MKRVLISVFLLLAAVCTAKEVTTRLDVASSPDGASVLVDGTHRGSAPVSVFDLAPGRHHLKVRMAGYCDYDGFVSIEDGVSASRNVRLKTEKGILLIKSEPSGCNISVDGVSIGMTPRLVTTLDAKDVHTVTLHKAGYRPSTFEVRLSGRTPQIRTETMVLDSGTIDITSEPPGAEVTVNGIVRGKTPLKVSDIPKGRATVRFRLDGFNEEIRELSMNAGDSQSLSIAMKGMPGTLSLTSLPPGARFYVDGEFAGLSPVVIPKLSPKEYLVRAELDGYAVSSRTIKLENGVSKREEFRLSNVMGRLEVRSSPPGAALVLDGKLIGVTKSADAKAEFSDVFPIENLMEGEHVLTVSKDGYAESVRHPKIRNSKTSQANVRLRKVFKPDVEIVTISGTHRGVLMDNSPEYVTVEISPGIQRSFKRVDIRKMTFLKAGK